MQTFSVSFIYGCCNQRHIHNCRACAKLEHRKKKIRKREEKGREEGKEGMRAWTKKKKKEIKRLFSHPVCFMSTCVINLPTLLTFYLYDNSGGNLNHLHFSEEEIGAQNSDIGHTTEKCQFQDLILGCYDFKNTHSLSLYLITSLPKGSLL